MEFLKKLKLSRLKNGHLDLKYGNKKLAQVDGDVLNDLISDFVSGNDKLKSSLTAELTDDITDEGETKTDQFMRYYFTAKKAFYKGRPFVNTKYPKGSTHYRNMAKAVAIAESHGVTPQVYLKSQIDGLKFINAGAGVFPTPSQLVTPEAENRLVKFVSLKQHKVVLTEYDKNTNFKDNKKFMRIYNACQNGEFDQITLPEISYVTLVLEHKGRDIPEFVIQARNHHMNEVQDG